VYIYKSLEIYGDYKKFSKLSKKYTAIKRAQEKDVINLKGIDYKTVSFMTASYK